MPASLPSRRPRSSPAAPLAPRQRYRSAPVRSLRQIRQHHSIGRVSNANSRYGSHGGPFLRGCSWSFTRRPAIRQASGEGPPPQIPRRPGQPRHPWWRGLAHQASGITMTTMGLAELRERAAELTQLSAVLAAAGSGRGQVCLVEGPSGVGKSRLLDECAASADTLGMRRVCRFSNCVSSGDASVLRRCGSSHAMSSNTCLKFVSFFRMPEPAPLRPMPWRSWSGDAPGRRYVT